MAVRAMYSGVAGLRNHQSSIDVLGNNIANINTVGFKSSRVNFRDIVSQTLRGAQAPTASLGGINPQQVGLGMDLGTIDTFHTQGSLLSTGLATDLSIEGNGFFKLSNGTGAFYTRNGSFDIDSSGHLASTINGYRVQGITADSDGTITSSTVGDIQFTLTETNPSATSSLTLAGNLDATSTQVGTILETESFRATEHAGSSVNAGTANLYGSDGAAVTQISGIDTTTAVTISYTTGGSTSVNETYTYGASNDWTTMAGLVTDFASSHADLTAALDTSAPMNGQIAFSNASGNGDITNFTISVAGGGATALQAALRGGSITSSGITLTDGGAAVNSDVFLHDAVSADLLENLHNASGTSLGIVGANSITINGNLGGSAVTAGSVAVATGTTTLAALLTAVDSTFSITDAAAGSSMSGGKLRMTGEGGTPYALSGMNMAISGNTAFNAVFDSSSGNYTETQAAADNHTSSVVVYGSEGTQHTLTFKFNIRTSSSSSSNWDWNAESSLTSSGASEPITSGGSGTLAFSADGALTSTISPSTIVIDATAPESDITIAINAGTASAFDGLKSFDLEDTAKVATQNGFAAGTLQSVAFDNIGHAVGTFSNGRTVTLARIAVTKFPNQEGLTRVGDTLFQNSTNSGTAEDGVAGIGGRGSILGGTLENSNVDLAQEFTNMIIFQRGFQANSAVIRTADQILLELVGLKR